MEKTGDYIRQSSPLAPSLTMDYSRTISTVSSRNYCWVIGNLCLKSPTSKFEFCNFIGSSINVIPVSPQHHREPQVAPTSPLLNLLGLPNSSEKVKPRRTKTKSLVTAVFCSVYEFDVKYQRGQKWFYRVGWL